MKKLTLTLCAMIALGSAAFAGTESYSGKETRTMQAPCPTWYADNEWNIGISGVYAPTNSSWREDRYLFQDHAWGGAIDIKYFWHRYFGFGVQGFGLGLNSSNETFIASDGTVFRNENHDFAGGVVGTFTFRYPIPCSRFAPYGWVGIGGIWGGGGDHLFFNDNGVFFFNNGDSGGRLLGQYGVGFETRFTPHFGWTNDVSFNQLEGHKNDIWMFRTGLNFAF